MKNSPIPLRVLAGLLLLAGINIALGQEAVLGQPGSSCSQGPGRGGFYDGPSPVAAPPCGTECREAWCWCPGSWESSWDRACPGERLCPGSCEPDPGR